MARRDLTRDEQQGLLDTAEAELAEAVNLAIQRFLTRVRRASLNQRSIVAAASEASPAMASLFTLGDAYGWWISEVDERITLAIRTIWHSVYRTYREGTVEETSLDGLEDYLAAVTDRLVRGLEPPLPEDAFNMVRVVIAQSAAEGWSSRDTADRIAAELSWVKDADYWARVRDEADDELDSILDPLGEPGSPIREAVKANDPRVLTLQNERTEAIKHLEAEQSHWNTRASRIARTESTAAHNFAALRALADEGVVEKRWVATNDARTRAAHRAADDETAPLLSPFVVGGYPMMFPGDPAAPPELTVNCRCTIVGAGPDLDAELSDLLDAEQITAAAYPRDGDGDGWIDDGKPSMRPAPPKKVRRDKWYGKPAPKPPVRPNPPRSGDVIEESFKRWKVDALIAVEAYEDPPEWWNAQGYGVRDRIVRYTQGLWGNLDNDDIRKALGERLVGEAERLRDRTAGLVSQAHAKADYAEKLLRYEKVLAKYAEDLRQWKRANGRALSGMTYTADIHHSLDAAEAWADDVFSDMQTDVLQYILTQYSRSSGNFNVALRNLHNKGLPLRDESAFLIGEMDRAMRPIPDDVIVRRDTTWPEFSGIMENLSPGSKLDQIVGSVYLQPAFMSTSLGPKAVQGTVTMRIKVPAGTPAAYLEPFTEYEGEYELLLARGLRLFIHSVTYEDDGGVLRPIVEAEVIPEHIPTEAITQEVVLDAA